MRFAKHSSMPSRPGSRIDSPTACCGAGPQGNAWIHLAWLDSPDTQERLFETEFFKEFDAGMERISGGTVAATPLFAWTPA